MTSEEIREMLLEHIESKRIRRTNGISREDEEEIKLEEFQIEREERRYLQEEYDY